MAIGSLRVKIFRGLLFLLSPVIALWTACRGSKTERLHRDIVDGMPWTMTHLRPDIIAVGDPPKWAVDTRRQLSRLGIIV